MLDKYNVLINSTNFDDDKVYLIEKICDKCGFFTFNRKIAFICPTPHNVEKDFIKTEYVSFRQKTHMASVVNHPSFDEGFYDILVYENSLDTESFDSFVRLCRSYTDFIDKIAFKQFFLSLQKLFDKPTEKRYKNLVGLIGELIFIKEIHTRFHIDVSKNWHSGHSVFDKYDFVFEKVNMDVKTTSTKTNIFHIKHNQLFNESNNFICLCKIENNNAGFSLNDLIDYFHSNTQFSGAFDFLIKLEEEINKTNLTDRDKKFMLCEILFFNCNNLNTIVDIPNCVANIEYDYDFSNIVGIDLTAFMHEVC